MGMGFSLGDLACNPYCGQEDRCGQCERHGRLVFEAVNVLSREVTDDDHLEPTVSRTASRVRSLPVAPAEEVATLRSPRASAPPVLQLASPPQASCSSSASFATSRVAYMAASPAPGYIEHVARLTSAGPLRPQGSPSFSSPSFSSPTCSSPKPHEQLSVGSPETTAVPTVSRGPTGTDESPAASPRRSPHPEASPYPPSPARSLHLSPPPGHRQPFGDLTSVSYVLRPERGQGGGYVATDELCYMQVPKKGPESGQGGSGESITTVPGSFRSAPSATSRSSSPQSAQMSRQVSFTIARPPNHYAQPADGEELPPGTEQGSASLRKSSSLGWLSSATHANREATPQRPPPRLGLSVSVPRAEALQFGTPLPSDISLS